jgi:DHA2 family multidrug resistance protein
MSIRYPDPTTRTLITLSAMCAAVMNQVDTTIANVALPHMQGSTSASREQITWVLTSYIVAAAIFTPLTGWLAGKFGRKRLMLCSIVGFTVASGLCGIATNLFELVAFRVLQGVFGSALIPMAQATLLDINPPEQHGKAMAVFGMAAIVGPLAGPLLGGYLTEALSWHWVFFINLPLGVLSFIGIYSFMPENHNEGQANFDVFGFGLLALGLGAFQLMLDRGQMLDWFDSWEICIEAVLAVTAIYLFVVHIMTAKNPFVSMAVLKDGNFVLSTIIGFFLGVLIYSVLSVLPPMLSELFNHPTLAIGIVMAPRGLGTLFAMLLVGRLINKVDMRVLIAAGMVFSAGSGWLMAQMSLQADDTLVIVSGVFQGIGASLVFVPLSTMAFATLAPRLRNEGAALGTLVRNLGGAAGIAVIQALTVRNSATVEARLTEGARPDNPAVSLLMPDVDFSSLQSLAQLHHEITRQALMVAYVDAYWATCIIGLAVAPLVFLLRRPRQRTS